MGHLGPPRAPALVNEDDFVAAQDVNAARGLAPRGVLVLRRYLAWESHIQIRSYDWLARQARRRIAARDEFGDGQCEECQDDRGLGSGR